MKRIFVAGIALATLATLWAVDISGRWQAEFDTQIGKQKYVYTFQVDGDKITGFAESVIMDQQHKVDLKEIKLAGDELTFVEIFEIEGNSVRITYKGKISGNEIKFTRQVGDFATEELVARRSQEAKE